MDTKLQRARKAAALRHLRENYTKAGHEIAFSGVNTLFKYYDGKLSKSAIREQLKSINVYTLHRETKKSKIHIPVYVYYPRENVQLDIATFFDQGKHNNGYNYILLALDFFTKKAWGKAIKRKDAKTVLAAFKDLYETEIKRIDRAVLDAGKEWYNRDFMAYAKEKGIQMVVPRTSGHAVGIERFIRTLKRLIGQWCTENDTKTFIPVLPQLLATYNSRYHRSIQARPNEVDTSPALQDHVRGLNEKRYSKIRPKRPKLREGELVRISRDRGIWGRSYTKLFSDELFIIDDVSEQFPLPLYSLSSLDGSERIRGRFHAFELTSVKLSKNLFIKRVVEETPTRVLVQFHNFPDNFQAWLNKTNLVA